MHEEVWRALESGSREERSAAFSGRRLKDKRNAADYERTGLALPGDASFALQAAQQILRSLEAVRGRE